MGNISIKEGIYENLERVKTILKLGIDKCKKQYKEHYSDPTTLSGRDLDVISFINTQMRTFSDAHEACNALESKLHKKHL